MYSRVNKINNLFQFIPFYIKISWHESFDRSYALGHVLQVTWLTWRSRGHKEHLENKLLSRLNKNSIFTCHLTVLGPLNYRTMGPIGWVHGVRVHLIQNLIKVRQYWKCLQRTWTRNGTMDEVTAILDINYWQNPNVAQLDSKMVLLESKKVRTVFLLSSSIFKLTKAKSKSKMLTSNFMSTLVNFKL